MIIAVILAAGKGSRVNGADKPKQYLDIGSKPMLCHTVEKFLACQQIDYVVIAVLKDWIQYTKNLFRNYGYKHIAICEGGGDRQESLYKAIVYCQKWLNAPDKTIILSHDAARPFVTQEIIKANIQSIQDAEVVTTAIPAVDTFIRSEDGLTITETVDRHQMYQVQTPQTFHLRQYLDVYTKSDKVAKLQSTDATGLLGRQGLKIRLIRGDQRNFKITTEIDFKSAEALLNNFFCQELVQKVEHEL